MSRSAREQTIRGLKFMRDEFTGDYDEAMFSYPARGDEDATGSSSILGISVFFCGRETVAAIQDSSVTTSNGLGAGT